MERLPEIMEILDKMNFFQGQRAGRELWNDKPFEVQEEDLEIFKRDINTIRSYIWEIVKELKQYRDAEEQGLLPRFHLGDEFWTIRLGKVLKSKIVMLQQKKDGSWQYRFSQEITPEYHDTHNYKESEFGKRFFLTKEEAEQALAKMKEV